jgi:hypothetical protein
MRPSTMFKATPKLHQQPLPPSSPLERRPQPPHPLICAAAAAPMPAAAATAAPPRRAPPPAPWPRRPRARRAPFPARPRGGGRRPGAAGKTRPSPLSTQPGADDCRARFETVGWWLRKLLVLLMKPEWFFASASAVSHEPPKHPNMHPACTLPRRAVSARHVSSCLASRARRSSSVNSKNRCDRTAR